MVSRCLASVSWKVFEGSLDGARLHCAPGRGYRIPLHCEALDFACLQPFRYLVGCVLGTIWC